MGTLTTRTALDDAVRVAVHNVQRKQEMVTEHDENLKLAAVAGLLSQGQPCAAHTPTSRTSRNSQAMARNKQHSREVVHTLSLPQRRSHAHATGTPPSKCDPAVRTGARLTSLAALYHPRVRARERVFDTF